MLPFTAVAAVLLFVTGSGLSPALGYLGKEVFYVAGLENAAGYAPSLLLAGLFFTNDLKGRLDEDPESTE